MDPLNDKLFNEFPPVPTADWEAKIVEDLKGADYEKKLIWKTNEGISVKPYYRSEALEGIDTHTQPGEYPFVRGNCPKNNAWEIRQEVELDDPEEANRIAVDALKRGATGIGFDASLIESADNLNILLNNIDLKNTGIHFFAAPSYLQLAKLLAEYCKHQKADVAQLKGSFDCDPISYLLMNGDFWDNQENDLNEVVKLLKLGMETLPKFKVINVNAQYFHNSGATLVQELAFALASANEYLAAGVDAGLKVDDIAPRIQFTFAVGSNYFMEIAKLRAARMLWAHIVEQYQPGHKETSMMRMHCSTSQWNKSLYDPYVNILRTTTEAMSAVLGGTGSLTIMPFDLYYKNPDEFSLRIARNQQIILKEESYLDKVVDPGAGSYYIESLTDSFAQAAWKLFQLVEEKGGMVEAVKANFIQDEIEKMAAEREKDVATRKMIFLGTNQYPNLSETMLEKFEDIDDEEEEAIDDEEILEDKPSTYKKLQLTRATDVFDEMRIATELFVEDGNKRPSVFLFNVGNLAMRKARAMFATNFFGCAGFEVLDNSGFASIDEGVKAALESKAEIITICSSDEEYADLAPEIAQKLKAENPGLQVMVAGFPKEMIDALKTAGVDDFIHVRCNLVESLTAFQDKLGIF